jgi:HlyD family secretion protein
VVAAGLNDPTKVLAAAVCSAPFSMIDSTSVLLSLRRDGPAGPRLRRFSWLFSLVLIVGFVAVFLLLFRDRLMPAPSVRVLPALVITDGSGRAASSGGALVFQASGWIEPDPLPIRATALTDGVIREVHVLEGAEVKEGDLLATLIEDDAVLVRDGAQRELERARAAVEAHATSEAVVRHQLEEEEARLISAVANATEAEDRLQRLERLAAAAIPETELVAARLEKMRTAAVVSERRARMAGLGEEISRVSHEIGGLKAATGAAEVKLAQAELALRRTRILAPVDGRVLRLLAAPGQKKMLGMDLEESATVAVLYHPDRLQVRVDVPLADAGGLGVGQRAKIYCNLLPDRVFEGVVTRITGEADLQRNTLQAKIRIEDPDERLRPEMLCRVEFYGADAAAAGALAGASGLAIFVPVGSIVEGAVWLCDPETKRVNRRQVVADQETRDGYRRIVAGVRPGEWVVVESRGLREGQRVNPRSESR